MPYSAIMNLNAIDEASRYIIHPLPIPFILKQMNVPIVPGLSTVLATVRMNGLLSEAASLIVPSARIAECRMKANKSNGGENREEDEDPGRDTRSGNRH